MREQFPLGCTLDRFGKAWSTTHESIGAVFAPATMVQAAPARTPWLVPAETVSMPARGCLLQQLGADKVRRLPDGLDDVLALHARLRRGDLDEVVARSVDVLRRRRPQDLDGLLALHAGLRRGDLDESSRPERRCPSSPTSPGSGRPRRAASS